MQNTGSQATAEAKHTDTTSELELVTARRIAVLVGCTPQTAIKYARQLGLKEIKKVGDVKMYFEWHPSNVQDCKDLLKEARQSQGNAGGKRVRKGKHLEPAKDGGPQLWDIFR